MACAISTNAGNLILWTPSSSWATWYYNVYRLTADVTAAITTGDIVAKVSFGFKQFLDIQTANVNNWYRLKAVSWSKKSSVLSPTIAAASGVFNFPGNVSVDGTLHVCGATTLGNNLSVTHSAAIVAINGNTIGIGSACSTVTVDGKLVFIGTSAIGGNTIIGYETAIIGMYGSQVGIGIFASSVVTIGGASLRIQTDLMEVGGEVHFTGSGTGLSHGMIYVANQTVLTTISAANVKEKFIEFSTAGPELNISADIANDRLNIVRQGVYLLTCSFVCESVGGGAIVIHSELYKNSGAISIPGLHVHRNLAGGGGDKGSLNMIGLATFTAGDNISMYLENDTNANDVLVSDCTLSIAMVGGL